MIQMGLRCAVCYTPIFIPVQYNLPSPYWKVTHAYMCSDACIHTLEESYTTGKQLNPYPWDEQLDARGLGHIDFLCELHRDSPNYEADISVPLGTRCSWCDRVVTIPYVCKGIYCSSSCADMDHAESSEPEGESRESDDSVPF